MEAAKKRGRQPGAELLLEVRGIGISFGGLRAVDDFSFELRSGELVGLIGPNGAGKTTVFNLLTGVHRPDSGSIRLLGREVVGMESWQISRLGVGRTFQNLRLFRKLTVLENVKIGLTKGYHYTLQEALFNLPRKRRIEREITERAMEVLRQFDIAHRADELAENLPYGEQKLVELARAWAARPRVLLLDEPAAGLNEEETRRLMERIGRLMEEAGLGILLIEHDMNLVMGICQRIIVLDYGRKIAEGTPEEIRKNERVIEAYLGAALREEELRRGGGAS